MVWLLVCCVNILHLCVNHSCLVPAYYSVLLCPLLPLPADIAEMALYRSTILVSFSSIVCTLTEILYTSSIQLTSKCLSSLTFLVSWKQADATHVVTSLLVKVASQGTFVITAYPPEAAHENSGSMAFVI